MASSCWINELELSAGGKSCAINSGFKLHSFTFFFSWHDGSHPGPCTDTCSRQGLCSQAASRPGFFWTWVLLYNSGKPQTHNLAVSASWQLGLQSSTTSPTPSSQSTAVVCYREAWVGEGTDCFKVVSVYHQGFRWYSLWSSLNHFL